MRLCAVSVDLDEVRHYYAIHGVQGAESHAVYDVALDRALEFAREERLPLTLFAVAADLLRAANRARLRGALGEGHEIGNHTKDHLYDLVRRSHEEQTEQVGGALAIFERELGVRPNGFRAPGYTVNDALLEIVASAGHTYDSSVFPCPAYYTAKAVALSVKWLTGRRSRAMLDHPRVLRAPRRPYALGPSYTRAHGGGGAPKLVELPIQVTRGPRLPYIGTTLILAGERGAGVLTRLVTGEPFINLELHGLDFLGKEDGLSALLAHQPDARVSAAEKRRILRAVIARLRREGYRFVRLDEARSLTRGREHAAEE